MLKKLLRNVAFSMSTFHLGEQISCTFADDERASALSLLAEYLFLPPLPFTERGLGGRNACFPLSRWWMTSQTASLSGEHLQLKCLSLSASIRLKRLFIERRGACPRDVENKMVMFSRIPTECCMADVCSDCRESRWTGCPPSPQSAHTARLGRP